MDRKELEHIRKERTYTDYLRFMKTYETVRKETEEEIKKTNSRRNKTDLIELNLNILKISEKNGLSQDIVKRNLKELDEFGAIIYDGRGRGFPTRIFFIFGKESSYLDKMLEIDKKENII